MLEQRLPVIRKVIINKLFIPYLLYLALYNYYTLYLMFNNELWSIYTRMIVKTILVIMSYYSFQMSWLKYKAEPDLFFKYIWNYFDFVPKIMVIISMVLQTVSFLHGTSIYQVSLCFSAVSSFILWINLLYFFRIFRQTGHLISMIIEVSMEIRNFVMILFFTLCSFSSAFYILSMSNP